MRKKGLHHFSIETRDILSLNDIFTDEEIGIFIRAVFKSCDMLEIQPIKTENEELKFHYKIYCKQKIQPCIDSYLDTCEKRKEAGAKGAKAKKEAADNSKDTNYSLPNKTDFRNLAKSISKDYELDYDQYKVDTLFDSLKNNIPDYISSNKNLEVLVYGILTNTRFSAESFLKFEKTKSSFSDNTGAGDFEAFMDFSENNPCKSLSALLNEYFSDEDIE